MSSTSNPRKFGRRRSLCAAPKWLPILALVLMTSVIPSTGAATEVEEEVRAESETSLAKAPWRRSVFVYRNAMSLNSIDPSAELTYNPYYSMSYSAQPWWWFDDHIFVRARLDLSQELTNADVTTYENEALLGDFSVATGYANIYTIPVAEIVLGADILVTAPTSKSSLARTKILGIMPGIGMRRSFDLLGGLSVGYRGRFGATLHQHTTSERETPLVPGCIGSSEGCGAFLSTGVRNSQYQMSHTLNAGLSIYDWLEVGAYYSFIVSYLYDIEKDDPRISHLAQEPQNVRYMSMFEASVTVNPLPYLGVSLGLSTVSPQLAPDSTYYNPLYNRYTTVFLDMQFSIEDLITQFSGDEGKDG